MTKRELLLEIQRMRDLAGEVACMKGVENHDHELCHDIAASIRTPTSPAAYKEFMMRNEARIGWIGRMLRRK